jgi:hypothetical protein
VPRIIFPKRIALDFSERLPDVEKGSSIPAELPLFVLCVPVRRCGKTRKMESECHLTNPIVISRNYCPDGYSVHALGEEVRDEEGTFRHLHSVLGQPAPAID